MEAKKVVGNSKAVSVSKQYFSLADHRPTRLLQK